MMSRRLSTVLEADECMVESEDGVVAKRDGEQVLTTKKSDLEGADTTDEHLVVVQSRLATMTIAETRQSHHDGVAYFVGTFSPKEI